MRSARLFSVLAIFALLISLTVAIPIVHGDGGPEDFTAPEKEEQAYPNLGSHLNQLVAAVEQESFSPDQAASDSPDYSGGSIAVTIYLSGNVDGVVEFLEDNGGDPRNVGEDYIEAYVPVTLLGQLSQQPGVIRVREIVPAEDAYGLITNQGVALHGASSWHDDGYTGQSVKVGIVDGNFDFKGYSSLIGTELPEPAGVRCYTSIGHFTNNLEDCEGGPDPADDYAHGTAVAEVFIDVAPGATLYLASPLSSGDHRATIDWMVEEGVEVIAHSEGARIDGPGDGTSPFSNSRLRTVDAAVDGGIIYVNAAGNQAQYTWFGDYSNPDGDEFVNFRGSEERNFLVIPEGRSLQDYRGVGFLLRWEDSWVLENGQIGGASSDLDLFIVDGTTNKVVASGRDFQSGRPGEIPVEFLGIGSFTEPPTASSYYVMVSHVGGDAPEWIQLFTVGPRLQYPTLYGSVTSPGESANPGMLAVGAAYYWDTHTIAPFSSRGPTPDGRVKPDIIGTACGQIASNDEPYTRDGGRCWFGGTSSAAPQVAGLAALVKGRYPEFTPAQVAQVLKDYAEERGDPGPDNTWGHGFAVLPPPGMVITPPTTDACGEDLGTPTADITKTGAWAAGSGCDSDIAGRGHARYYSFELAQQSDLTITLESDDADTYLYLRDGDARSSDVADDRQNDDIEPGNSNSQLQLQLSAGTYTIEATTYEAGETGSFTLSISGLGGDTGPVPDACAATEIVADGQTLGQWSPGCDSAVAERGHARYYTFELVQPSDVTITLESDDADTYLYLRDGDARSGDFLHENDDHGGSRSISRIEEMLAAGTYTIEASTYEVGETGNFTLTVSGVGGDTGPALDLCYVQPMEADGTVTGKLAADCQSKVESRSGSYARYYSFELAQQSDLTITLESDDADTYLYLRDGDARSGDVAADRQNNDIEPGNTNSQLQLPLPAGKYTIEATTYEAGETGSFTLTVTAASAGADRAALVALYNATGGANWTNNSHWLTDAHISLWYGVTTDGGGRVTTLNLANNQLSGELPAKLGNLTSLQELWLYRNQLSGEIPAELGNLTNLQELWLGLNQLNGAIPAELGNLTSLEELWISDNQLSGEIPQGLTGLTALELFDFHRNPRLCAPVGSAFQAWLAGIDRVIGSSCAPEDSAADRAVLVQLYQAMGGEGWARSDNWLGSGRLREWRGVTTDADGRVNGLLLSGNQLSGQIPMELGNLTGLTELWLYDNQLSGRIPVELGNLSNLATAYLHLNELSGVIPAELGRLTNLQRLSLSDNQLSGEIPVELGNLGNLDIIRLAGNQLTGCIPTALQNVPNNDFDQLGLVPCEVWEALVSLYDATDGANWTNNSGWLTDAPIGEWHGVTTDSNGRVTRLDLRENQLSGEIPAELGSLLNLMGLWLSDNQLSGEIPAELGSLSNLTGLGLYRNQLSGEIPAELGSLSNLTGLWLYRNQLSGEIPAELGSLSNLRYLSLSNNQLSGEIPAELGSLSNLEDLFLGRNQLSGEIPAELGGLSDLEDLSLSDNQLSGRIPAELGGLLNLMGLWLHRNELSGEIPAELGSLSNLRYLSLSNNELSGEIPAELGSLSNLEDLFLGWNQLSGRIPAELGDLDNLDRIGLAGNQLIGCVPVGLEDVPDNDFDRLGLDFCDDSAPPPSDGCIQAITADDTVSGQWADDCLSQEREDSYARYYTFTLAQPSDVTITLESNDADTYLYLRDGDARSGAFLQENDDDGGITKSTIQAIGLTAGTYTIEATTYAAGETGSFTLTVRGLDGGTGPAPDPCAATEIVADGQTLGQWTPGCDSAVTERGHARYYTFTLAQPSDVTITLESSIDAYLYLRDGDARSGAVGDDRQNDDIEPGNTNSQIVATALPAGTYTIEATTYEEAQTGSFTLTFSGLSAPGTNASDRAALVSLYYTTDGANWTNNSGWLTDAPYNEWYGIVTDSNGRVHWVVLNRNSLSGPIPTELGDLTGLRYLYLNENQLNGPIPEELRTLPGLGYLLLNDNQLTGMIPAWMGEIGLELLWLSGNQFSGCIPASLRDVPDNDFDFPGLPPFCAP